MVPRARPGERGTTSSTGGTQVGRRSEPAQRVRLAGVLVYGDTQERAAQLARALAFRVLADQIEAGEVEAALVTSVSFAA